MTVQEIINHMAKLRAYRAVMYLSKEKMEQWYIQKVSPILEVGASESLSGKISAGLPGLFSSEGGGQKSSDIRVSLDNEVVQGVVAENVARASDTLISLSATRPEKGELCYYLGTARTTLINELVSPENSDLSAAACSLIQTVREAQEESLRVFNSETRTMVLTFKANDLAFASICSTKSVNPNWPTSYGNEKHFGILSTLESVHDSVVFLDPIWIWHE